jgi:hypothetical protein
MIKKYIELLKNKGTKNFWKKAKQKEYTKDAVNKIYHDLTAHFEDLTTRNSITLRYLGLVINLGSDNLKVSNAGETFISSPYKQKILDEQIMKIYLDCPRLNDNLSIKIAPMEILLHVLYKINFVSFEEYQLFVCWINSKEDVDLALDLISEYRQSNKQYLYMYALKEKSEELGISDFSDNVKRFFDMLLISSYITKDYNNNLSLALSKKDTEIILESFSLRDFSDEHYFDYLTTNNGWQIYSINPNYIRVIESLEKKTTEEQEDIINNITNDLKFPNIDDVKPKIIEVEIDDSRSEEESTPTRKKLSPHKIDFEIRDNNNRAAGDFAEKIVIKHEIEQLSEANQTTVDNVKQVSLEDDTLGYDILSFDFDGVTEKHIEVKAVRSEPSISFRFYISENEVLIAKNDPNYYLYIVFGYLSDTPYIYKMPNPFTKDIPGVTIDPIKYIVTVKLKK